MKKIFMFLLFFIITFGCFNATVLGLEQNPKEYKTSVDISTSSYYCYENREDSFFALYPYISFSKTSTYVADDGTISVFVGNNDDYNVTIYEYNSNMEYIRTLNLPKELPFFGTFTRDKYGNYYVLTGIEYYEELSSDSKEVSTRVVKYDRNGNKLKQHDFLAWDESMGLGVKKPFYFSNTIMRTTDTKLAFYTGREMFVLSGVNHQASLAHVLDLETFESLDDDYYISSLYVSHSLSGFLLADKENNEFEYAMIGDGGPRAVKFVRLKEDQFYREVLEDPIKLCPMQYQQTYSKIAGFEKTEEGYIFAGATERNSQTAYSQNDSRNLYIQKIDKDFTTVGEKKWITSYNCMQSENAGSPKMIAISGGRYLLMWELMGEGYDGVYGGYMGTYMTIIDKDGNKLQEITKLPDVRLSPTEPLMYNPNNNRVYWSVINPNSTMSLFSFNPDEAIEAFDVPVANCYSGDIQFGYPLTLTYPDSSAKIYYTLNGDTPTENSTLYQTPIILNQIHCNYTLKAVAIINGRKSKVCTYYYYPNDYLKMPVVSLQSGTYDFGTVVHILDPLDSTIHYNYIYYTLDGTHPDPTYLYGNTFVVLGDRMDLKLTQDCKLVLYPYDIQRSSGYSMVYEYKVINHPDYQEIENGYQEISTSVLPEHMIGVNGQHSEGFKFHLNANQKFTVYLYARSRNVYTANLMDKDKNVIETRWFSEGETIDLSHISTYTGDYYLEVGIADPKYLQNNSYEIDLSIEDVVRYSSDDLYNLKIINGEINTTLSYNIWFDEKFDVPETITYFALYDEKNKLVGVKLVNNPCESCTGNMQLNFKNLTSSYYTAKLFLFKKDSLQPMKSYIPETSMIYPTTNN